MDGFFFLLLLGVVKYAALRNKADWAGTLWALF
jgi:hypothetical protein